VTPEERQDLERFIDEGTVRVNTALAVHACLEAHDAAIAIARRVHAEYGPRQYWTSSDPSWIICRACDNDAQTSEKVIHKPNCLWLAAETLLKNGEGKP
jgi:hypothetical protein